MSSLFSLSSKSSFFGLSSFQILAMFRRGLFYTYLSIYLRSFLGLSVTETTLFATLPMIVNVACQMILWGPLSDKFQLRRTLVILGEIFAGFSTLLVFFGHRFVRPAQLGLPARSPLPGQGETTTAAADRRDTGVIARAAGLAQVARERGLLRSDCGSPS